MSTSPPPIPGNVDLRGLEYMPLFGNHLFGSDFNTSATDSEWRAALTLWWAAWNQVPAGSLPDDDIALCRLADLGRDLRGWKRLKSRALHGFVRCDDGRLYHKFLCSQALIAWEKRISEKKRKQKWREEQQQKKQADSRDVPRQRDGDSTVSETRTKTSPSAFWDADVPADGNRRDGTGRDGTIEEKISQTSSGSDTTVARLASSVRGENPPSETEKISAANVQAVFDHWRQTHNHPQAKLDGKRRKLIAKALAAYSDADLCQTITGYRNSPHHMGENDRGTVYDDIELMLRDAKHIDAGLKFYRQPPSNLSSLTRKNIAATEDWVPPEMRNATG